MQWSIFKIVVYSGTVILFFVTAFFGVNYRQLPRTLQVFTCYLALMLISDVISKYLFWRQENNLVVLHLFNYAEWLLLSIFFHSFLDRGKHLKFKALSAFVLLSLLMGSLGLYQLTEYNVIGFFVLKIFIISLSVREIYLSQFEDKTHYYFINIGLLISAVVNLVIFTFGNKLSYFSADVQEGLWLFNAIVFMISLFLFSYELMLYKSGRRVSH